MRETSIMDNVNYKMQAHARACKENKEKINCPLKYFLLKDWPSGVIQENWGNG